MPLFLTSRSRRQWRGGKIKFRWDELYRSFSFRFDQRYQQTHGLERIDAQYV